jgi:integrase
LIRAGDTGEHVDPTRLTVAQWIERWIASGAPGRRKKKVGRRTLERYEELLRCHVIPTLGTRPLQQLQATEIDSLYANIESAMSARSAHHVHTVFSAALSAAVRTGLIVTSPMARVTRVPSPGESDHGQVLDAEQLGELVKGFRGLALYPIVTVAAFTGARRNEILALRWVDLDASEKTLRIERAIEETNEAGRVLKNPKTSRGKRTIQIDDDLLALLLVERDKHLRIKAGVPEGIAVDLSLVKLPADALMFPSPPAPGEDFSFTKLRGPENVTKEFMRRARKLGFPQLRFHDLSGNHETILLDSGVPVHVVAARCGHDPAVLLRTYAKRTKKADTSAAVAIGLLSKAILGA